MDRPTCATCPYWHDYVMGNGFGQCRRIPPVFRVSSDTEDPNGLFPESLALHFCGEHPDFPAWIESLKAGTPPMPDMRSQADTIGTLYTDEHGQRCMKLATPPTAPPSPPPTPRE